MHDLSLHQGFAPWAKNLLLAWMAVGGLSLASTGLCADASRPKPPAPTALGGQSQASAQHMGVNQGQVGGVPVNRPGVLGGAATPRVTRASLLAARKTAPGQH